MGSNLPGVSLLCPTFNTKPWLLNEAVFCFIAQDYKGPLELVILNDCKQQTIICNHPHIKVVNTDVRYSSLGSKRNALVEIAKYDYLCLWDDDDISLPHRVSKSVEMIGSADYFNPKSYWFLDKGRCLQHEQNTGYAHQCSMFTRKGWLKAGKYPDHNKDDAYMDDHLKRHCTMIHGPLTSRDTFYIYRWGVSYHLSGNPDINLGYNKRSKEPIESKTITIQPTWYHDYMQAVKTIVELGNG